MDHVLGKKRSRAAECRSEQFGSLILTFADDAVIFTETTEVILEALESLSEEAEPLGLRVSWIKTNSWIQAFGDILDATVE